MKRQKKNQECLSVQLLQERLDNVRIEREGVNQRIKAQQDAIRSDKFQLKWLDENIEDLQSSIDLLTI